MRRILNGFANEGVKILRLGVTMENAPAFNLYRKLGYIEFSERTLVYFWKSPTSSWGYSYVRRGV